MFYGLTPLGTFHTAISIVALIAGIVSLFRYKDISLATLTGKVYVITTIIVCLTGFGIFQHGGFGKPHVLGIVTLVVLALAVYAERKQGFGKWSPYVRTIGYSATFLFHWIPTFTEGLTRLPYGAPLLASPEAPELKAVTGVLGLLFLIGAGLQVKRLRATQKS